MKVMLKNCYTIKPAEPTPNVNLPLSDSDQIMATTHAPTIYFYKPTDYPFESAIETLKTSLSRALTHFYPLAGRLHRIDNDRLSLECNSMGAQIYEAECDGEIADFGDFRPTPELQKLIPSVDYNSPMEEIPLLLGQLTKLRCGVIGLGLLVSHVIADGASALHFISEWARIGRGEPLEKAPFLDRTAWKIENRSKALKVDHLEFSPLPLLMGKSDNNEERIKETSIDMLKLNKSQVEKLKNQANNGIHHNHNVGGRPYSRYEVVAAHLWRSATKARGLKSQQPTNLRLIVNCRNRIDPPLPEKYFGNVIFPSMAISVAGDLVSNPLSYGASRLRESIEKMSDEYIKSAIDYVRAQSNLNQYRVFHTLGCPKGTFFGNPNINVTSWIGLPLSGTDFGWGKEFYVGPGSLGYEGKCFILSSPDEDGSLVIPLRLQTAHLDSLKKFFYEDI